MAEGSTHILVESVQALLLAHPLLLAQFRESLLDPLAGRDAALEVHQPAVHGPTITNGDPGGQSRRRRGAKEDLVVVHPRRGALCEGHIGADEVST